MSGKTINVFDHGLKFHKISKRKSYKDISLMIIYYRTVEDYDRKRDLFLSKKKKKKEEKNRKKQRAQISRQQRARYVEDVEDNSDSIET